MPQSRAVDVWTFDLAGFDEQVESAYELLSWMSVVEPDDFISGRSTAFRDGPGQSAAGAQGILGNCSRAIGVRVFEYGKPRLLLRIAVCTSI
jgi:hypothetical protein